MVRKFVRRVEVGVETVTIHFIIDKEHYRHELALCSSNRRAGSAGKSHFSNFFISDGSNSLTNGAQVAQVDEPLTTFIFELEAKAVSAAQLTHLHREFGSFYRVAEVIGASEAFVRQNAKAARKKK